MQKSEIFILLAVSFTTGVLGASLVDWDLRFVYGWMAVCVSLLAVFWFQLTPAAKILLAAFIFAGVGVWRFASVVEPNQFESLLGSKQKWEGYIVEEPDVRAERQLLTFLPSGYSQRVLITASKNNYYDYGDWVVVEGTVKEAKNFSDFDYQGYLERFDVFSVMQYPKILVLKSGRGNSIKERILEIKHWFVGRVSNFLVEPQSSLLLGILIGAKKTLPQNLTDQLATAGLSHIVAVSGFNISVIIGALHYLSRLLGRRFSFVVSLCLIGAFVVLTGASASVIRAAVMGMMLLLAFELGRPYSVVPVLVFAAAVMVWLNPKIVWWDMGFQLSFAATLGIVAGMRLVDISLSDLPGLMGLKNILFTTFFATLFTLPLALFHFGRVGVYALPVNLFVLPIVPYLMLFGFLILLPGLAAGFAQIAKLMLVYVLKVAEISAVLPGAKLELKISGLWLFFSYLVLGFVWWGIYRRVVYKKPSVVESQGI
jgi:competence protein ComEC